MIRYLTVKEGKFIHLNTPENAEIIQLFAPDASELQMVERMTNTPADFLSAACDKDERPRIETENRVHLLIVRVPHEDRTSDVPVVTVSLGIILAAEHIVTVCSVDSPVWELLSKTKTNIPPVTDRLPFLCTLLMSIARMYLTHLQCIRSEADAVERELHYSMRNEMLIKMLNLEKCLVYFATSLRGLEPLLNRLKRISGRQLSEDEQDLIDDVSIEFRQAHDLAEIHSNILSGMMDAFASVISNNLNVVMKFLTSITIILMLPTLIVSIYGMNVPLPFQNSPHAFLMTMVMSIVLSALGVIIFLKKKFF